MIPVASHAGFSGEMANAAAWLTPAMEAGWRWDLDGSAILWEDDTTVVLAEELALICDCYDHEPMPPLAAVVSALAMLKGCTGPSIPPVKDGGQPAWPVELVKTPEAKQVLLDLAFHKLEDPLPATGEAAAKLIRMNWRPGVEDQLQRQNTRNASPGLIRLALGQVSPAHLRLRLETGLETLVQAAPALPLAKSFSPQALMRALETDPETAGISLLARDIMAAVTLPQVISLKEERATSGVSDLSNRGPIHRLLLSELAHDDDMLAARLAMGEALYLQPEPPAHRPPGSQVLVLDSGLRLWGAARVFALAAALALRLKARPGAAATAWCCAKESHWEEVQLDTLEGIKAQLKTLAASYDLTGALATLPQHLSHSPDSAQELVLIIHDATLHDAGFRRELATHLDAFCPLHLVTVDAEGRLALHQYSRQGIKQVHQATLKLEKLLAGERGNNRNGTLLKAARSWPAVFGPPQLPFLLAPASPVIASLTLRHDSRQTTFGLTQNREIWYLKNFLTGGRPLAMEPLRGKVLEFRVRNEPEADLVAAAWDQDRAQVQVVVVPAPAADAPPIPKCWVMGGATTHPRACWVDGDCLVVLTSRTIRAVRLSDGMELPSQDLPDDLHHLGERHFWSGTAEPFTVHHCLVQGNTISFPAFGTTKLTRPVLAFHRKGQLGMWSVGANGVIMSPSGNHHMEGLAFPNRLTAAKASADGRRVWMKTQQGPCFTRDLETGQLGSNAPDQGQWLFFVEKTAFAQFSMRTRFEAVGLTPGGEVALRTSRGRTAIVTLSNTWFRLEHRADAIVQDWRTFGEPEATGHFCTLRTAEWPGGSRAYLDDRGILHLQAANPALAEVSIALPANMMLPAWSSDGLVVGPAAAMDSGRPVTGHAQAIEKHIRRFVTETLS